MTSEMPLKGAHAVVTGGNRGIGLAIAERLSALGATLTLIGRDRSRLYDAVQELPASAQCDVQPCDVRSGEAVQKAFDAIARTHPGLSILVNNAGVARSAKFASTDESLWNDMIAVNLTGTYHCTRAALRTLLEAPAGRIVNVASTAGLVGYPYVAAYCAAKHGVIGLTRALALELAATHVTVNAVCPGYTDTELVGEAVANIVRRTGKTVDEARAALASRNPQKRLIAPDEVASAVSWLCLPASQSITGQAIAVAGGEVTTG
ncbi:MAG TPA: SDR family NAD(P)-dependent oxidoreductase [Casimicrobiaceae bacterium]|nr:SDR family NAD(P)-dependent oxidoreductase [Casimicrobiaceae bacterium]